MTAPANPNTNFPASQLAQDLIPFLRGQEVSLDQIAMGVREIANDGAVALAGTDSTIIIANSTTGNKAMTTSTAVPPFAGQTISIRLVLCTGNSYTLALVSGTLTFNAAGEGAIIVRNGANTGWLVAQLLGATIV